MPHIFLNTISSQVEHLVHASMGVCSYMYTKQMKHNN